MHAASIRLFIATPYIGTIPAMTANANDTEPSQDLLRVTINKQPVELYKILKFEGLVGTGGEAKAAIAAGRVRVNKSIATEKRKKIVAGDTIEYGDVRILIALSAAAPVSPRPSDDERKPKKVNKKPRPAITQKPAKR